MSESESSAPSPESQIAKRIVTISPGVTLSSVASQLIERDRRERARSGEYADKLGTTRAFTNWMVKQKSVE